METLDRATWQARAAAHAARVDVWVQEAVEQHEAVGACRVQSHRHLAGGAEVRAELHRNREGHHRLDLANDLDMSVLDGPARGMWVAGHEVDVELERGRAGGLDPAGEVDPAANRASVEAGDHWDVDGADGLLDETEVARCRPGQRGFG